MPCVPSPVAHTWASSFSFAHRQYLLVRTYAPGHWLFAGWTLCVPALAAGTAIVATLQGSWWAGACLLCSVALLQIRLSIRRGLALSLLPASALPAAEATIAFARWAWPLIHAAHCVAFFSSGVGRGFRWAGIDYRLHGRSVSTVRPADPD